MQENQTYVSTKFSSTTTTIYFGVYLYLVKNSQYTPISSPGAAVTTGVRDRRWLPTGQLTPKSSQLGQKLRGARAGTLRVSRRSSIVNLQPGTGVALKGSSEPATSMIVLGLKMWYSPIHSSQHTSDIEKAQSMA